MNHGTLESLRDQFKARIGRFQGGSDSDGYSISFLARRSEGGGESLKREDRPTLTAVLASSSEARLPPPCLLLILSLLLLRGVRVTALSLGDAPVGEPGGETVMTPGVYNQETKGQTNSGGETTTTLIDQTC